MASSFSFVFERDNLLLNYWYGTIFTSVYSAGFAIQKCCLFAIWRDVSATNLQLGWGKVFMDFGEHTIGVGSCQQYKQKDRFERAKSNLAHM